MRIVITGGTGLIGQHLALDLVKDHHEVIILSRSPERPHDSPPEGMKIVKWDGQTTEGWLSYADGAKAIVNLAGESLAAGRWTDERKARIMNSRIKAGQAVAQAVEKAARKPEVVIQASAIGYYGPRLEGEFIETSPPGNDFGSQVCIRSEASSASVDQYGVRRVILRTGVVLDAQRGALPPLLMPFRFFVGGPIGSGKQWFSWIHISDEIRAIRFLIENPQASGAYNLCAPGPMTNAQFAKMAGRVLKRPAYLPLPGIFFKLLFGEMSTVLLDGQKVIPMRLMTDGFTFHFPDAESALRDLLHKQEKSL